MPSRPQARGWVPLSVWPWAVAQWEPWSALGAQWEPWLVLVAQWEPLSASTARQQLPSAPVALWGQKSVRHIQREAGPTRAAARGAPRGSSILTETSLFCSYASLRIVSAAKLSANHTTDWLLGQLPSPLMQDRERVGAIRSTPTRFQYILDSFTLLCAGAGTGLRQRSARQSPPAHLRPGRASLQSGAAPQARWSRPQSLPQPCPQPDSPARL